MVLLLAGRSRGEEELVVVVENIANAVRISASDEALRLFFTARGEGAGREG